jgi:hypothetical protein
VVVLNLLSAMEASDFYLIIPQTIYLIVRLVQVEKNKIFMIKNRFFLQPTEIVYPTHCWQTAQWKSLDPR